jgi:1-aminocyclopropane-1-carboxylate deaminase/D-cysteine desulfhydrase-like pyridoxal-dependent ACC family enzyme
LFRPSPVHRLERLTSHLGGAQLWAEREDCNSGIAYGGNKTRKLEYLVGDALALPRRLLRHPRRGHRHPAVNGYSALFS